MATIVAVRSGIWSDTSHVTGPWPGESTPTTKPGVGDTVQAGEFVVEIDEDVHVAMLEATGSGYFAVSNVYPAPQRPNITAAIVNNGMATGALQINGGGTIGDITGDLTAGNANNARAVYNGGGTIGDITGDLTAGDANGAFAVYNGGGTIGDITGDLTAGDADGAWAVYNGGGGTIGDITGDITAGDANGAWAVYNGGGGTIGDITGDITAGDANGAWAVYNDGTIGDIDGSLICGATGQFPIFGPFRLVANPANSITVRQPNGDHWTLSNGPVSIVIGGGGIRIS